MSDEIRINRPASQQPAAAPVRQDQSQVTQQSGSKMPWIVLGVIIVILIAVAVIFRGKLLPGKDSAAIKAAGTPSGYEAVFLTNGQVYFGKLSHSGSDYLTLDDIYYLQVGPQQGSGTAPTNASSTAQQQITLVKLGNELHGPVDEMHINRSQVLFYEDLKSDGQVVKAILQDKAAAATPAAAPAPAK
jgi:hypothetical protein